MGMFDEIISHYPLPDFPEDEGMPRFQTKSLECTMDLFTILEDGRLIHDETHYESVPDHERPYPNDKGLLGIVGSLRQVVDKKDVLLPYTGPLYFYHYRSAKPEKNRPVFSIDYFAYFEKGILKAVIKGEENWSEEEGERQVYQAYLAYERAKLNQAVPETDLSHTKKHI